MTYWTELDGLSVRLYNPRRIYSPDSKPVWLGFPPAPALRDQTRVAFGKQLRYRIWFKADYRERRPRRGCLSNQVH